MKSTTLKTVTISLLKTTVSSRVQLYGTYCTYGIGIISRIRMQTMKPTINGPTRLKSHVIETSNQIMNHFFCSLHRNRIFFYFVHVDIIILQALSMINFRSQVQHKDRGIAVGIMNTAFFVRCGVNIGFGVLKNSPHLL